MSRPCDSRCWDNMPCPEHGWSMPPRGRSVSAYTPPCCRIHEDPIVNPRHLWSIHDSDRACVDYDGWQEHLESCEKCQEENQ